MFPYFCTASRVQLGCTPQNGVCVAIRHSWTMPYQSLSVTETLNQALRSLQACVYRNESLLLKKRKNSNRSHGIHVLYACVWRLKLSLLLLFAMREKQKKIKWRARAKRESDPRYITQTAHSVSTMSSRSGSVSHERLERSHKTETSLCQSHFDSRPLTLRTD